MRGHVEKRGERFVVIIDLGRDERGERVRHAYRVVGGKRDAERELVRRLREVDTGTYAGPAKQSVERFLRDWLDTTARLRVSANTLRAYRTWITARLIPSLGHHRLDRLTAVQIDSAYSRMMTDGLGAQSITHCHRILHCALESAVRQGLLARNPCDAATVPRQQTPELRVLTEAQINVVLDAAGGSRLYVPILLAAATALRRGEVVALRWEDVDLDAATMAVRRSATTAGGLAFKSPKSGKGRSIAMPSLLVDALTVHKAQQAAHRLRVGPCWEDNGLVVANEDGTPVFPDTLTHQFHDFIRGLDVPPVRYHDLRHSAATLLLSRRVPVKIVSEILGHSTSRLTLDRYGHVMPTIQREAAVEMDNALRATKRATERA